ncbi:MAG: alpha-galactosidase, partial [Pontixanthobacter sp.]
MRCATTFSLDSERPLSFFSSAATGWFGEPALRIEDASGAEIVFVPKACEVDESSDTLTLTLTDEVSGLEATIVHRKMAGGALEISTALTNCGVQPVTVLSLASVMIPLPADAREIVSWRGRHNAEFTECREAMPWHGWQRVTRQGLTGHGGPPACVVLCGEAGWHRGTVFAVQLAWSGNSRIAIERCENAACVLLAEAVLSAGEVVLQTGDTYEAPPVMLAISDNGRNGARAQQHAAVRERLDWPSGAMPPRPVHLNSWEAVYFAQNEARMIALVEAAAELGVERFVLDDGWFAGRESDRAGLGDWTPDPVKYPNGLEPLAKRVEALGMQFGIWVEPEMVNPDSDLYRAHPDWLLALKGREQPTARHQLVLDMRRADVRDYLFDCLD